MRKSTTIRRLKLAHDLLNTPIKEIGVQKFDMGTFGEKDPGCGTAACGVGTLSLFPEMHKIGLKGEWVFDEFMNFPMLVPYGDCLAGSWEDSLQKAFGITEQEAWDLYASVTTPLDGRKEEEWYNELPKSFKKKHFQARILRLIKKYENS